MKKLSQRILSSLPAIFFFAVGVAIIYTELESALRPVLYERFALNSPTPKEGMKNAGPLIRALKMYKAEHQYYPTTFGELPATQDVFWLTFVYKYEPTPSAQEPQEYMLSFRKRWSTQDWYCYYSGDGAWLQTSAPCWETLRKIRGSKMPVKDYH